MMREFAKQYPGYAFERNVGYGTGAHERGLKKLGVCPIHRRSYRPIKKLLQLELPRVT
jgi:ribonuclease HII